MKKQIENILYHYKKLIIIVLLVVAAALFIFIKQQTVHNADYSIAIISRESIPSEKTDLLISQVISAGQDIDLDGTVSVDIHHYALKLGIDGQDDAQIGALDADLVGFVSGLFITDDPDALETATNGIFNSKEALITDGLSGFDGLTENKSFVLLRNDHKQYNEYAAMLEKLAAQIS